MDIVKAQTSEEFVRLAAQWISGAIAVVHAEGRQAVVGLSGGSTPQPVYALLAADQHIDWKRVTFFLLDERYVPSDHSDSNQRMIREVLLTRHAAAAEFLAPDTSLSLADCVQDYAEKIAHLRADAVLLGIGEDGHIASLFPPVPPEAFGPATVLHTQTDRFAVHDRISVTFPPLLKAAKRLFLIGSAKEPLLKKMQRENEDVSLYPAQYLFDERTTWIVGP